MFNSLTFFLRFLLLSWEGDSLGVVFLRLLAEMCWVQTPTSAGLLE